MGARPPTRHPALLAAPERHWPHHWDPHPARAAPGSPNPGWDGIKPVMGVPWGPRCGPHTHCIPQWSKGSGAAGCSGLCPGCFGGCSGVGGSVPHSVAAHAPRGWPRRGTMRVRCSPGPTAPGTALGCPKDQPRGQARGHRPPPAPSGPVLTPAGEGPSLHVTLPYMALCPSMSFCPYTSPHPYVTVTLQVTPS